jgi:hemolysin D
MSFRHKIDAYKTLAQHYRTTFNHFWRVRKHLGGDIFNEQEAEFLPAALSLQEKPISRTARLTGRLMMLMVLAALLWSIFGYIDIIASATGKVIPSSRTKTISSVDVASVRALHVTEGQRVHAGDLLVELDASATDAEHDKALGSVVEAKLQIARSQAMISAVDRLRAPHLELMASVPDRQWQAAKQQLEGQFRDFYARLKRLDGEIFRYSEAVALATQRANDFKALLKDKDVSQHAWLEKEQARVDLEGQLSDAQNQRSALMAQTRKEAHDALLEASKAMAAASQDQRRAGEHSKLLRLLAPVDGTVQQLTVHTVGGVVPAAQPLMLIVPSTEQVEVEAFLENKDIGFVHIGQKAEVKIDAFDYTRYGTIAAKVTHISQDAIQDEKKGLIYSTRILLDKSNIVVDRKNVPLSAGMSVNVEIKTGTRRVIAYVLSPLMQHQRESLNER